MQALDQFKISANLFAKAELEATQLPPSNNLLGNDLSTPVLRTWRYYSLALAQETVYKIAVKDELDEAIPNIPMYISDLYGKAESEKQGNSWLKAKVSFFEAVAYMQKAKELKRRNNDDSE